jgi:uncharacterized repeat protein (TIGR01451 family)
LDFCFEKLKMKQNLKPITMKLKLTLALMLCGLLCLFAPQRAQAGTISIDYAGDSSWVFCPVPVNIDYMIQGTANGYNSNADTIFVTINFGDGQDTTFAAGWASFNYYYAFITHTYTTPGIYSVQYIATGPDGASDTLIVYNEVVIGGTCGNIYGKMYHDLDADCTHDAGEPVVPWAPLMATESTTGLVAYSYSDGNGDYYFDLPSSYTYTVTMGTYFPGFSVICPASGSYTVSSFPSANNNFGLTCSSGFDLNAQLSGWGYRPGFPAYVYATVNNWTCNPASGTATITIDPLLTITGFDPPAANATISGNTVTWNLGSLDFATGYEHLQINVMTSLLANIGDTVCNTISVSPISGDNNPGNNSMLHCNDVRNSWDPNMKELSPKGMGAAGNVPPNTEFTYTVHFQNTGTDVAYNIYILDTLDSDLDLSTLKVLSYSHDMHMDLLPGNIMKFNFDNIMLADSNSNEPASHGFVMYSIKTKSGLANGTQMPNTAYIYFDFNPAVITNTTMNTIDIALGMNEKENAGAISISPNPASDEVRLRFTDVASGSEVSLVDMMGKIIATQLVTNEAAVMNVSQLPAGMYMIHVKSAKGTTQQKLLVVH